jgi:glycosyltransferase involved in cell wall biosynthesis
MFSESLRRSFRDDLGISGRTVLVYSGGVASWQKIGNVISLFNYLKPKVSNLFMLFLTHEPYLLEGMIKGQIHPGDLKVLSVPHREVGAYLCAADVGVLLRENTLTNHVASPIKFSEYMCCGLPCILSSNIGDTAEIIHKGNAGIILNKDNGFPSITEFRRLLSLDRKEIADSMRQKFASDIFISKILTIYQDLAKSEK